MSLRRCWLATGPLLMVIGLVYSVFLFPYVQTFHIKGDDFAVIFNSARQYHPNPASWVTQGYSSYFSNFPDMPEMHTYFCRPVVNSAFWLESLLSPGTGPLNLMTNYVALVLTLILFMFFLRRETGGNILFLSSMLVVYAFSAMWYEAVMFPAFRCSLLMALFALAAFLLLPSEGSRHQGLRIALSIICQVGSLLSHETGVVTPVIAGLLFVLRRDGKVARDRLKVVPLFLLPLLCFAALRLVFYGGVSHVYVLGPLRGWVRNSMVNTLVLLAKPFFPWDTPPLTGGQWSLREVIAALMNLAGYALVAYALLRGGKTGRGPLLRVLLCLGVALAVVWVQPAARFMQLAAVFSVLAAVVAVEQIRQDTDRPWVRRGLALGLVGLAVAQFLIYLGSFPQMKAGAEAGSREARVEFEGLRKAIAAASAPTLLLVNDQAGLDSASAMLEMGAWPNRGRVKRLITVDNWAGEGSPQSNLRISRDDQGVRMEIVAGPSQQFTFCMVDESKLGSEFANQGLHYETETVRWYSFTARLLRHLGKTVGPDKVRLGRRLVVTVPPEIARDGLLIVGFDPRNMSSFSNDLTK